MARLFGTDGVRGVANTALTPELAFKLGRAATALFGQEMLTQPLVVIGRDTRISGQMLEAALAAGICAAGGKAVLIGVVPTPAIAYLTRKLGAQAGVVISASHNPYQDNGIKFFAGTGYKLPDEVEDKLENLVMEELENLHRPTGEKVGVIEYRHELINEYNDYAISTVAGDFKGMKIVLDCSHGAAFEASPKVFKALGAKVVVINDKPNGLNINHNCGSTHLEGLQKAVIAHKADIGIAHDGDADRCLAVDEKGEIIDGDQIMVICALEMLKDGLLKENTLVTTVMSNIGLHQVIKANGGKLEITPVGDRYVLENMLANGYNLGGEQSGHIIFSEFSTTGDGLITALQLTAAVARSGKKASELAGSMTRFPQLLVNVRVKTKDGWETNTEIMAAIKKGEEELGELGRILVRPSGTEQLIRVMAEGPDQEQLDRIVKTIADIVKEQQG